MPVLNKKKALERNPFCRAVGVGSKNINFSNNSLEMDVEMAVLMALSFSVAGDDELCIECNDIPRGEKNCTAQRSVYEKIKSMVPYRRFDNFYERAEFFFLNYVADLPEAEFITMYAKIKKIFVPHNLDGKRVPMVKAKYGAVLVYDYPTEVYINVKGDADVSVLVKSLKSVATKCADNKFMKNLNNPLSVYDVTKGDVNIYFFCANVVEDKSCSCSCC